MRQFWDAVMNREPMPGAADKAGEKAPSQSRVERAGRTLFCPQPSICAITDVGRVRDHNEDAFHVSGDCAWLVVADGMGGYEAGEVAAALAIEVIAEHLTQARLASASTPDGVDSLLLEAVDAAHARVREASRSQQGDGKEMGCTLAICCLRDGLVTCHVGDVRCYLMRGSVLHQVTRDHSTVAALVEAGQLTPEEARVHPKKNEVLQGIGMPSGVRPDVNRADLAPGDRILLCSDGLWEALSHEEMQSILASDGTVRQLAVQLVDRANSAGGHDNITAILSEALPR